MYDDIGLQRIQGWKSDDLILISDVDEVPDIVTLRSLIPSSGSPSLNGHYRLLQSMYYYHVRNQLMTPGSMGEDIPSLIPMIRDMSYLMNYGTYIDQSESIQHYRTDYTNNTVGKDSLSYLCFYICSFDYYRNTQWWLAFFIFRRC